MTLSIMKDVNFFKKNLVVGKISKFLAIGWDSLPIFKVPHKDSEKVNAGITKQHLRRGHFW